MPRTSKAAQHNQRLLNNILSRSQKSHAGRFQPSPGPIQPVNGLPAPNTSSVPPTSHSFQLDTTISQPMQSNCSAPQQPVAYEPTIVHAPHPDSRIFQSPHWVPYPLGLLPYDSWHFLHHPPSSQAPQLPPLTITSSKTPHPHPPQPPPHPFRCPVCLTPRPATLHARKLFLVAERLLHNPSLNSPLDKSLNQELTRAVNFELGILDPLVEDPMVVPGGQRSRDGGRERGQKDMWYPFASKWEGNAVLRFVAVVADVSEASWAVWVEAQKGLAGVVRELEYVEEERRRDILREMLSSGNARLDSLQPGPSASAKEAEIETIDLTDSPELLPKKSTTEKPLPNSTPSWLLPPSLHIPQMQPPPSLHERPLSTTASTPPILTHVLFGRTPATTTNPLFTPPIQCPSSPPSSPPALLSFTTLCDFYSLLDNIERTSFVAARFLEAYAERLRDDECARCWLGRCTGV